MRRWSQLFVRRRLRCVHRTARRHRDLAPAVTERCSSRAQGCAAVTSDRATARAFVERLYAAHHSEIYAYLAECCATMSWRPT